MGSRVRSAMGASEVSSLFGTKGDIGVNRGLAEFHAGRPVLITGRGEALLALPVEGLNAQRFADFVALCAPARPRLIVTVRRALALGLDATTPMALRLKADDDVDLILAAVADAKGDWAFDAEPAGSFAAAAVQLAKLSQGLPAVLAAPVTTNDAAAKLPLMIAVEADAVAGFGEAAIRSLAIASESSVPLNTGTRTRFVVFRDAIGGSPVAIIVGKPNFSTPVPVRLHSACLTGDVFGSRRCDCGDQLKLALSRLEDLGGGIILYLAAGGPRARSRQQDAHLSDAGRRARYCRCQYDARLRR